MTMPETRMKMLDPYMTATASGGVKVSLYRVPIGHGYGGTLVTPDGSNTAMGESQAEVCSKLMASL